MKPINILMIKNNECGIVLTMEAFDERKLINKIQVIKDGKEATRFFEMLSNGAEKPNLVLPDINLPKVSGHEVLKFIKRHKKYRSIPVIMLTTSSAEKDIMQWSQYHANCYIAKPIDINDFIKAMAGVVDFWINIVSVPAN